MNLELHAIAELLPIMSPDEFDALREDIKTNGLHEPIWIHEGKILDGRHRYKICHELGIPVKTRPYEGPDPFKFSISVNAHRRHLTPSQRATYALSILPTIEAEAKERQVAAGVSTTANAVRNEKGEIVQVVEKIQQPSKQQKKSIEVAAAMVKANPHYVADAKKIAAEKPELIEEISSGRKTIVQAKRELKEEKREQKRQDNREKIEQSSVDAPIEDADIQFPTIVIDPPWDWGDEGDKDQMGRARPDYQTMAFGDLLGLPVDKLSMDDAHIYLWITNRSLPKGFALLEHWGFRYVTCITWVKPHFGMGNYFRGQTEQILFGVKGSLPLKRKDVGTVLSAPRGSNGHSSKPEQFYELVESCSHGPYLEMFSRLSRTDWTTWGENGLRK